MIASRRSYLAAMVLPLASCSEFAPFDWKDHFPAPDIVERPAAMGSSIVFTDRATSSLFALDIGDTFQNARRFRVHGDPGEMKTVTRDGERKDLLVLARESAGASVCTRLFALPNAAESAALVGCYDNIDVAGDGAVAALTLGKGQKCASEVDAGCTSASGGITDEADAGLRWADGGRRATATPVAIGCQQPNGGFVMLERSIPLPPPLSIAFPPPTPRPVLGSDPAARWILASSSGQVVLMELKTGDSPAVERSYSIDLRFGSFAPNEFLFDANGTRIVAWARGWQDAVIIELVDRNGQAWDPKLRRVALGRPARAAVIIGSPAGELFVSVTDPSGEGAPAGGDEGGSSGSQASIVSVDLATDEVARTNLPFDANVVVRLGGGKVEGSAVIWQASAPASMFAIAEARALQQRSKEAVVQVVFPTPYRRLTPLDNDTLVLERLDGGASLFRASDGLVTALGKPFSLLFVASGIDARLLSSVTTTDGATRTEVYGPFGTRRAGYDLPGEVKYVVEVDRGDGRTAQVLVHPSTLGSVTVLTRDTQGNDTAYTQRGFLKDALERPQ